MTSLPRRLFSTPASPILIRKSFGASVAPEGVLIYPGRDLQGDELDPEGGRYELFERNGRTANLEHGPHVGTGEIVMKAIPVNGELVNVPVATTTFFKSINDARNVPLPKYDQRGNVVGRYTADECLAYAEQTAPLVLAGDLDGLSVEFRPNGPTSYKSLGAHPMLPNRDACQFHDYHVLHYAHCNQPVNNNARLLLDDDVLPRAEKAFKLVFESPGTLDLIRKSFRPLAEAFRDSRKVVVPVKTTPNRLVKADMPADPMAAPMPADPAMGGDMAEPSAAPPVSVATATDAAQAILDAMANAESAVSASDNPAAKKAILGLVDAARKHAAKFQAFADKLAAQLETNDDTPIDAEADAPEPEMDESGMIQSKAFPAYIPAPRRLKKSDVRPPVPRKAAPKGDDPAEVAAVKAELEALKKQLNLN